MLTEFKNDLNIIQKLDDEPNDVGGLTAAELKAKFDEAGLTIQAWINEVFIPALVAANLKFQATTDIPANTIQAAIEHVQEKSKETGETLGQSISDSSTALQGQITENYDTLHKEILQAVMGAIPETSVTYKKLASDVTTILDNLKSGLESAQGSIDDLEKKEIVIDPATQTKKGLMSADDKKKLDGIAAGATNVKVDNALSETSTNAIMNKAVHDALNALATSIASVLSGKAAYTHTHTKSDITDLVIDASPTDGSSNPVESGGVYAAISAATEAAQGALDDFKQTFGAAPMMHIGGLMAAQAHQGGHNAYSTCIQADAFQDNSQIDSYSGVYFRGKQLELLTEGLPTEGTIDSGSGSLPGSGDYNASNVVRTLSSVQVWTKLFDFYPDRYGTVTNIYMKTLSGTTTSQRAKIKLGIFVQDTSTILWESALTEIPRGGSADAGFNLPLSFLLNPNQKYTMNIWIESMPSSHITFSNMKFTVTPNVFETGSITMKSMTIPEGASHLALLLHDTGSAASVAVRFGSGEFATLTQSAQLPDAVPGGISCTLRSYSITVPENAQTVQLKIALPSASCKVYDYAMILV